MPGQSSLLENSEGMSPRGIPNQSAIVVTISLYYRGYPPEHVPGQSSLLENSEGMSPRGTPNQSAIVVTMGESEGEEEEDEDTIGELQKMKLDDSALSTQVNNQKGLRVCKMIILVNL